MNALKFIALLAFLTGSPLAQAAEQAPMSLEQITRESNTLLQQLKRDGYLSFILKLKDNKYFFDAFILGQKVSMMLDTGAEGCLLDEKIARKLKLTLSPLKGEIYFMHGAAKRQAFQAKAPLQLGEVKIPDCPFLVYAKSGFSGILGMNLLKPCNAVLDMRAGVLHLRQPSKPGANLRNSMEARGYVAAPIRFRDLSPFVKVSVGGVEGVALVDSGAHYSVLDLAFLDQFKLTKGKHMGHIVDGDRNRKRFYVTSPDLIKIGAYSCSPQKLAAVDLSYLRSKSPEKVLMILGADLLHENNAVVDFAGDAVYLKR